jgi:hypothetical protein
MTARQLAFLVAVMIAACATTGHDKESTCGQPRSQGLSQPCCILHGVDACGAMLFCAAFDGRSTATCYQEYSRMDGQACNADHNCKSGKCTAGICGMGMPTAAASTAASSGAGGASASSSSTGSGSGGCGNAPASCQQACDVAFCCGKGGLCPSFTAANQSKAIMDCKAECDAQGAGFISFVDPKDCATTISDLSSVSTKFKQICGN